MACRTGHRLLLWTALLSCLMGTVAAQTDGYCETLDLNAPFNFSERVGLVVITEIASLSLIASYGLLGWVLILYLKDRRTFRPFRDPLHCYFISLLFSDGIQAIGAIMDAKWVALAGIEEGPYCTTQGIFRQMGDVGVALASLGIAVHTYRTLVWKYNPPPESWFKWAWIAFIWVLIALLVGCGYASGHTWDYYGNTKYWCWIRSAFRPQQIGLEYVFMWFTAFVNIIVYVPLFISLHGKTYVRRFWQRIRGQAVEDSGPHEAPSNFYRFILAPMNDPDRPIFADVLVDGVRVAKHQPAKPDPDEDKPHIILEVVTGTNPEGAIAARQMLWLPIWYFIQILPLSLARFLGWSGYCVPFPVTLFSSIIFSSSGWVNVLLFTCTRPMFLRNHHHKTDRRGTIHNVYIPGAEAIPEPDVAEPETRQLRRRASFASSATSKTSEPEVSRFARWMPRGNQDAV